jgi:multicomponent Na+:H+ antiporter subunit A
LPKYLNLTNPRNRIKDVIIATTFGTLIALLALEVWQVTNNNEVSRFYAEHAYTLAKGKNVVNVILVDFRGIDTLMESVVLTVAAIGVFSLLKLRLHQKD